MKRKMLNGIMLGMVIFMGAKLSAQSLAAPSIGKPPVTQLAPKSLAQEKMTQEQTAFLLAEIQQNEKNPAFDLKTAKQQLFSSRYLYKGLYDLDASYPLYVLTGDKAKDQAECKRMKQEWISQYPEKYQAILVQKTQK